MFGGVIELLLLFVVEFGKLVFVVYIDSYG